MTSKDLEELVDVSKALLSWTKELARYDSEPHLNDEDLNPWVTVAVGNHPTYLSDFKVKITDPEARATIKEIMVQEVKHRIRSLETKLRYLKGK